MFKKILVPTDGSALSEKAVDTAIDYARATQAQLFTLCVAEPYPLPYVAEGVYSPDLERIEANALDAARATVDKVCERAAAAGVKCEGRAVQSFSPFDEIVRTAGEQGCDLICMASHGRRGLNRLFVGSETQKVLAHTQLPVLVLR